MMKAICYLLSCSFAPIGLMAQAPAPVKPRILISTDIKCARKASEQPLWVLVWGGLDGDPNDPTKESWGGSFVKLNHSPQIIFDRPTTAQDTVQIYSIMEF